MATISAIQSRLDTAGVLTGAIESLAYAGGIDDVVTTLRQSTRQLIGADGIAVILREGQDCRYVEEDAIGPLWKGKHFPLATCISGWAMVEKQTVVIEDISTDTRIPHHLYADTFVKSLLMVPVRSDDPIGAIGAYWARRHRADDDQIQMLERLARATATAIENVRLVSALSKALDDAELARDELKHRVKNAYAATQALASLTLPAEHSRALNTRIAALARAHDLLDKQLADQDRIGLAELIAAELEPYATDNPDRISVNGPALNLTSAKAIALGLAINELATNALKYGALSHAGGRIDVSWEARDGVLSLDWIEADGPLVGATGSASFGSRLLHRLIEGQLGGTLSRSFEDHGVACRIIIPAD